MLTLALALTVVSAGFAAAPAGTGAISGAVYFDGNGNGLRDLGEAGIAGATVIARDAATNGGVYQQSFVTGGDGLFTFGGLNAGDYTVSETDAPGYISTTAATRTVAVSNVVVLGQDFGDALPLTVAGIIYDDLNANGEQDLNEAGVPGAVVEVLEADAQTVLGSSSSDDQGAYIIPGIFPGERLLRVQRPGGQSGPQTTPMTLISSQVGGNTRFFDLGLLSATVDPASVTGVVWNDADGDEIIDDGEARLPDVLVYLNWIPDATGGVEIVGEIRTGPQGEYGFSGLQAGNYEIIVDNATIPAGWVANGDPEALHLSLVGGQQARVDIGYYDPLHVAPLRVAEWKEEFQQRGSPRYSPAQLSWFVMVAEWNSPVFPELVGVAEAISGRAKTDEQKARKQLAALEMNLASARLLPKTPVNLPALTRSTTVEQVEAELDAILYPPAAQPKSEYRRAEALADALNNGVGLGYGLTSVARLSQGVYDGNSVVNTLRQGGATLDFYQDAPVYLQKWSPGALPTLMTVFRPQLRVKVHTFYNGAVLEAMQRLPDGSEISLGLMVPTLWNKDVKATYVLDLWRVASLNELAVTEIRLYVRDSDDDTGAKEHVKIDAAEVVFGY
jgi:hypothetical protein